MDVVVVGSCNIDLVRYVTLTCLIDTCHHAKRHRKCVVKKECTWGRGFKDFKDCAALTVYSADTQTFQLNKGYKHIKNISSN